MTLSNQPEPTLSNQPEPIDRDTLIRFYESYCIITFIDDGKAILSSQGGIISPIVIDEKLLLEPSAANLADFKNQLSKELLELSEPFAPTDETNEYIINGERRRIIDRAFDRFDWRGRRYSGSQKSEVCSMPYALCPMPYALCPVVPHLSEKGYITDI